MSLAEHTANFTREKKMEKGNENDSPIDINILLHRKCATLAAIGVRKQFGEPQWPGPIECGAYSYRKA